MRLVRILIYFLLGFVALGVIRYQQLAEQHHLLQAEAIPSKPAPPPLPQTLHLPYTIHRLTLPAGTDLTPRNALAQLHEHYRLPPDRRFILGLLQLQKLLAPDTTAALELKFLDHAWQIYLNKEKLAQLSEFPDFVEAKQMLLEVSTRLRPSLSDFVDTRIKTPPQPLRGYTLTTTLQRLRSLNESWRRGNRDIDSLLAGVDALARLSWSVHDLLEDQDTIMARTLSLMVLAERGLGQPLHREESMLAEAMGYHSHAKKMAEQLRRDDPWRLFVLKEKALLSQQAQAAGASADSIDLWLAQLARDDTPKEWTQWFNRHYDLRQNPVFALQTAYSLGGFYPKTLAIRMMPLTIARVTEKSPPKSHKALEELAKNLELDELVELARLIDAVVKASRIEPDRIMKNIAATASDYAGPFFDAEAYQSYYRGIYFSSLYRLGLHYLDHRNDLGQATRFSHYLGSGNHPSVAELSTWYGNLLAAQKNQLDMEALLQDLRRASHIGTATLERTLEELLPRYSFGSPHVDHAVDYLFSRLDSRISHRFTLAGLSRSYLLHLSLSEKLYNSIEQAETRSQYYLSAWLGKYHGRPEQVTAVVGNQELAPYVRGKAAGLLVEMEPPAAQTEALLRKLVEEHPQEWKVHDTYIQYLQEDGDYDSAMAVAMHWLKHVNEDSDAFDYWNAVIAVSRQQLSLGNAEAAWQAVNSITESEYGGALYQATQVKLAQSDMDGALAWARRGLERYPSSDKAILNMAEVLWHQGKHREAAKLLLDKQQRFGSEDWRWQIGARFAETFTERSAETVPAFRALRDAGLSPEKLMNIPPALADKKLFRLAFDTQKELKFDGWGQAQFDVNAYVYLAKAEGREAAIKWLDARIPANRRNFAGMIFFGENQFSLLWDLIPDPASDRYPETVWLYRAAALAQGAPLSEQRRSRLMEYYQNHSGNNYDRMGRYILGFSDGSDLLETPMNERTLSESAFYFGLAALRKSRLDEACDWFKLATRYSSTKNGEYRWSYSRLYRWKNAGQSLQVQLDQGKLISLSE